MAEFNSILERKPLMPNSPVLNTKTVCNALEPNKSSRINQFATALTLVISVGAIPQITLACSPVPFVEGADQQAEIFTTPGGVEFVRTPDRRFDDVVFPDINYEPQYLEIDGLRLHYVEAGPADGEPILLLHGEPSWSYLYRTMLPVLADAGYRAIAIDFIGAGRSDKPIDIEYYRYTEMTENVLEVMDLLEMEDVTLVAQDWGAAIGLRAVGLNPERFARVTLLNGHMTVIPEGMVPYPEPTNWDELDPNLVPFYDEWPDQLEPLRDANGHLLMDFNFQAEFPGWMAYTLRSPRFHPSETVEAMTWFPVSAADEAAYDAPYPSRIYMALIRYWPSMVMQTQGLNADAWEGLKGYESPFITMYAPNDIGILGEAATYQNYIDNVPGASGQKHVQIPEAGHFLQEDKGAEIATRIVNFIIDNPLP